jgi:hypothetical protein
LMPAAATVRASVAVWVNVPAVPVITTFTLPAWALLPAVRVTLCGVPGVSVNVAGFAVTPAGKPLTATLTVALKPSSAVADNCTGCPAAPIVRLRDAGLTANEKSACAGGGATTLTANVAVCVSAPEVPVSVTVPDSAAVPAAAARLSVAAFPGVSVSDAGWAVTPGGSPERATDTLPENPLTAVANTETVDAVPFDGKLTEAGVTLSEKSAAAACTEREPWVLTAWPPTVVLKESVAVEVAAEAAAVSVTGNAVPGVSESVEGEIETPVGNPDTVTVAALVLPAAVSSRDICCPPPPAVSLMLEGDRVKAGAVPLLPLPLLPLPPQDARPTASRPVARLETTPINSRRR